MKFLDSAKIYLQSGSGGSGAVSFRREKFVEYGGPNGGDAGDGADLYFIANPNLNTLIDFRYRQHFKAPKGQNGKGKDQTGERGKDLIVEVPVGTVVLDETKENIIYDFKIPYEKKLMLKGGMGGRGNASFKTSVNKTPRFAQPGMPGEEMWVWLELEILADIGLIGKPNAGKSTLVSSITNAKSKSGNYAFTTLKPKLGVLTLDDKSITIADLPGLIKGASEGKGLGTRFLSHVKRCKAFLHLIDITSDNIQQDYTDIISELENYNVDILNKKQVIVLTKVDMVDNEELEVKLNAIKEVSQSEDILSISCITNLRTDKLVYKLFDIMNEANKPEETEGKKSWSPL